MILSSTNAMKIQNKAIFLAVLAVGVLSTIAPSAFAQSVSIPSGTSVPGCEEDNSCWDPTEVTVEVGATVTWTNNDVGAHTVTAGDLQVDPDNVGLGVPNGFDSGMLMAEGTFSHLFDVEGSYPYFCMIHPWMVGTVVVEAMAEEVMEEAMMTGVYLSLDIDPMLPFDNTANDMVTLSFTAISGEGLEGSSISPGVIDHLDYAVIVSKDGNTVWKSAPLHDHDGNLELQVTPSEGSFKVTGGDDVNGQSGTGPYMVTGPVFMDNGNYQVTAQIVGIEFKPLSTPLIDDFTMEVVPEFGSIVMVILAAAIVGTIVMTTKSRVIPKL